MLFAASVFFGSLLLIVVLFGIRFWELKRDRILAPGMRDAADRQALRIKSVLERSRLELEKVPPRVVRMIRVGVRDGALSVAGLARVLERQAHRLADLVSHKHRFERRESKSDYLKQVTDFKNGQSFEEKTDL